MCSKIYQTLHISELFFKKYNIIFVRNFFLWKCNSYFYVPTIYNVSEKNRAPQYFRNDLKK